MQIDRSVYGVYHPNYDNHVYRNLTINGDGSEPFNRGHDDDSIQYGPLTVDGLTFDNVRGYPDSMPLIQISDDNPTGKAVSHFRNVKVVRQDRANRRPGREHGRRSARHAEDAARRAGLPARLLRARPRTPRSSPPTPRTSVRRPDVSRRVTADRPRVARGGGARRRVSRNCSTRWTICRRRRSSRAFRHGDTLLVSGTTSDNGPVKRMLVNDREVRATRENFSEWVITLDHLPRGEVKIEGCAEDAAGNREPRPHLMMVR